MIQHTIFANDFRREQGFPSSAGVFGRMSAELIQQSNILDRHISEILK